MSAFPIPLPLILLFDNLWILLSIVNRYLLLLRSTRSFSCGSFHKDRVIFCNWTVFKVTNLPLLRSGGVVSHERDFRVVSRDKVIFWR